MINMVGSEWNWRQRGLIRQWRSREVWTWTRMRWHRDRRLERLICPIPRLLQPHSTSRSRSRGRMACRCRIRRVQYGPVVCITVVGWAERGAPLVGQELKDNSEELTTFRTSRTWGQWRKTSTNKMRIRTLINIQCSNRLGSWTSRRVAPLRIAQQTWAMLTALSNEAVCSMAQHPQWLHQKASFLKYLKSRDRTCNSNRHQSETEVKRTSRPSISKTSSWKTWFSWSSTN